MPYMVLYCTNSMNYGEDYDDQKDNIIYRAA
jgi:hypothetical protein